MPPHPTVVMARVREAYLNSGRSYAEIGRRMGYPSYHVARKRAFEFVNHVRQPSAAQLARFAFAVGVPVGRFLAPVRTR